MRAILKSKHQRFCNWLHATKDKLTLSDHSLDELETKMEEHYNDYLQKREDLRVIIQRYEERQNAIRNIIKQRRLLSPGINNSVTIANP